MIAKNGRPGHGGVIHFHLRHIPAKTSWPLQVVIKFPSWFPFPFKGFLFPGEVFPLSCCLYLGHVDRRKTVIYNIICFHTKCRSFCHLCLPTIYNILCLNSSFTKDPTFGGHGKKLKKKFIDALTLHSENWCAYWELHIGRSGGPLTGQQVKIRQKLR